MGHTVLRLHLIRTTGCIIKCKRAKNINIVVSFSGNASDGTKNK